MTLPVHRDDGHVEYDAIIRVRVRVVGFQVGRFAVRQALPVDVLGDVALGDVALGDVAVVDHWETGYIAAVCASYAVALEVADEISRVCGDAIEEREVVPARLPSDVVRWISEVIRPAPFGDDGRPARVLSACPRFRAWSEQQLQ